MNNIISTIEHYFNANPIINQSLNQLIIDLATHKIQYPINQDYEKADVLFQEKFLLKKGNLCYFNYTDFRVTHSIQSYLMNRHDFIIFDTLGKNLAFFDIIDDFLNPIVKNEKFDFSKECQKYWLIYLSFKTKVDFKSYILSTTKFSYHRDFWSMMMNFSTSLPYLNLVFFDILTISQYYLKEGEGDGGIIEILKGLENFATKSKGYQFYEYLLENKIIDDVFLSVLVGLQKVNPLKIIESTKKLFKKLEYQKICLIAFSRFEYQSTGQIKEVIKLVESSDRIDLDYFFPNFYKKVLNCTNERDDIKLVNHCFNQLEKLSKIDDINIKGAIANAICRTNKSPENKIKILINITSIDTKYKGIIRLINRCLKNIITPSLTLTFFTHWAIHHPFQLTYKNFDYSISNIISKANNEELKDEIIKMLTHKKGSVRHFAVYFIDKYNKQIQDFNFREALKTLNINQLHLFLNVSAYSFLANHTIAVRLLCNLIINENETVKQELFHKMVFLLYSYGKSVIQTVEESIEKDNHIHQLFFNQLKKKDEKISQTFKAKRELKEINSLFTHNQYLTDFHKIYFEEQSQQMQKVHEGTSEDSFLSTIQNISIVRGRAFKIEGSSSK